MMHALKFFLEAITLFAWLLALAAFVLGQMSGNNTENTAQDHAFGDLIALCIFAIGFLFFVLWALIVHFRHLPWWL
jgi:hypothetical protein